MFLRDQKFVLGSVIVAIAFSWLTAANTFAASSSSYFLSSELNSLATSSSTSYQSCSGITDIVSQGSSSSYSLSPLLGCSVTAVVPPVITPVVPPPTGGGGGGCFGPGCTTPIPTPTPGPTPAPTSPPLIPFIPFPTTPTPVVPPEPPHAAALEPVIVPTTSIPPPVITPPVIFVTPVVPTPVVPGAYQTNDLKAFFFEQFPGGSGNYDIVITGPDGNVPLDVITADPGYFSVHIKDNVPDGDYTIEVQDLNELSKTKTLTLIVKQMLGIPEPELISIDQQPIGDRGEQVYFSSIDQPQLNGKTSNPAEIAIFSELLQQTFIVQTDADNDFTFVYPEKMVAGVRDSLTIVARYPNGTLSREQTIQVEFNLPKMAAPLMTHDAQGLSCPIHGIFCSWIVTLLLLFVAAIIGHFFLFPSLLNVSLMLRSTWLQRSSGGSIRFVFALLVVLALMALMTIQAMAATTTPQVINYQGVLKNAGGTPITTAQTFRFSLWSDADYDTPADFDVAGAIPGAAPGFSTYQEVQTITPDANGFFQVQIGSVTALPNFNIASQLFLQVEVKPSASANTAFEALDIDGVANTNDRQPLGSTPYVNNADFIDNAEIGTGAGDIAVLGVGGIFNTSVIPGGTIADIFVIDSDDTGGDVTIQFGTTLGETLTWDNTNFEFDLSDNLNITGGIQTSGNANFSGTSEFHLRESPNPTTLAACTTVNELIVNTTLNRIEICTATGGAGSATWIAMPAGDASSLSGLLAGQFLRSDTSDNFTSGTLTTDSGTTLTINGDLNASAATQSRLRESANPTTSAACTSLNEIIVNTTLSRVEICTATGIAGAATWIVLPAGDANTLDGVDSTQFLRSDTSVTYTSGTFTLNAGTSLVNNGTTTLNDTTNINGTAVIGDGGDAISIDSSTWDISTAGVGSGFTGFTSTGTINFSGATTFHGPEGAADPATCTVGEIFFNTTTNSSKLCTATNTWTVATGPNGADLLDGFDSGDFLRSNASDNYTSGTLTLDSGTTLEVNGVSNSSGATQFRLRESANPTTSAACTTVNELIVNTTANRVEICTATGIAGLATWLVLPAGDATTVDGIDSSQFMRNDTSNTVTAGTTTYNVGTTITNNGTTNLNGTTNINGSAVIGDGGDVISIDSSTWDISTAGVGSGFTGFTSTGIINFSGATTFSGPQGAADPALCTVGQQFFNTTTNTFKICTATNTWSIATGPNGADLLDGVDSTSFLRSDTSDNFTSGTLTTDSGTTLLVNGVFNSSTSTQFRVREDSDPNTNAACASVGELIFNTTTNQLMRCTVIGAPGTWTNVDTTGGGTDFEAIYLTDADDTLTTSNGNFTINSGTGTITIDSNTWDVSSGGVASGFTGFTSTGTVDLSGASRFATPSGAATPGTCTKGDLYFNTTINTLLICTATNTFSPTGPYNKSLVYEPVYADAVIQPDGTTNNGTLESFFVDTDGDPGNNNFNYYKWTTTQGSLNDNDLVIRFHLPEGFISFQATPIQFTYRTDTASIADNRLDVTLEDTAGTAVTLTGASALAATGYTTANITFSGSPTFTAGQSITLHIKMSAKNTGAAYSARLGINYYGQ